MKKTLLATFVMMAILFSCSGCAYFLGVTPEPESTPVADGRNSRDRYFETADIGNSPESTPGQYKSQTYFYPNLQGIKQIINLKKDEIVERLGDDYEIVTAGPEGMDEGYYYEAYGMEVTFNTLSLEDYDRIDIIQCDEKVSIEGAKVGMAFSEIKSILGEGEDVGITVFEPMQPSYALVYHFDGFKVWFAGLDKNGVAIELQIRREPSVF